MQRIDPVTDLTGRLNLADGPHERWSSDNVERLRFESDRTIIELNGGRGTFAIEGRWCWTDVRRLVSMALRKRAEGNVERLVAEAHFAGVARVIL